MEASLHQLHANVVGAGALGAQAQAQANNMQACLNWPYNYPYQQWTWPQYTYPQLPPVQICLPRPAYGHKLIIEVNANGELISVRSEKVT